MQMATVSCTKRSTVYTEKLLYMEVSEFLQCDISFRKKMIHRKCPNYLFYDTNKSKVGLGKYLANHPIIPSDD